MLNDLSMPGSIIEHLPASPSEQGAIRAALRDLKALLPAGSTRDILDAALGGRSAAIAHMNALTEADGLVDDLRWSCPWLMPRAEKLLQGWRSFIAALSELIEGIREGRHRRLEDRSIAADFRSLHEQFEELRREESALMFELFNDPPALD